LSTLVEAHPFAGTAEQVEWYWRHRGVRNPELSERVKRKREKNKPVVTPLPTLVFDSPSSSSWTTLVEPIQVAFTYSHTHSIW